jgi:peptidoglycan/xylan/chitin deacetylase (PgdA/CDA1 family)
MQKEDGKDSEAIAVMGMRIIRRHMSLMTYHPLRNLLFAFFILLFLSPSFAGAQSANLVPNPDFETENSAGGPAGWTAGRWGTNIATFTYPSAGVEGSRGAEVSLSSRVTGDAKWAFPRVPITPGKEYQFSDHYLSNVTTHITLQYEKTDGSLSYADILNPAPSASFKQASMRFRAPSDVKSVTVFHLINTVGSLTVDRFSLTEVPPPDASNLIKNPSFEGAASNGLPEFWVRGRWGTNTAEFTFPVPGHSGANGARVALTSRTSGDAKWAPQEVPTSAGESYTFSDFYRSDVQTYLTVEFRHTDGSRSYRDLGTLTPSDTWRNFTGTFTVPANTAGLTVFHIIKNVGYLEVDSYSLRRTTANTDRFSRGLVSIHFDDGTRSSYDIALPILDAAGMKSTHFITTDYLKPTFPGYIKPNEVRDIRARGHEIGAHSRSHPDLTALSVEEARSEIAGSRQDLLALSISPISFFAYPFGAYNAQVKQLVLEAGHIGARSSDGGYNLRTTDKLAIKRQPMTNTTTFAHVKGYIDTALAEKTWVVLLFHEVNTSGRQYSVTPALFEQIVDYLEQKGVTPVTMSEAWSLM